MHVLHVVSSAYQLGKQQEKRQRDVNWEENDDDKFTLDRLLQGNVDVGVYGGVDLL